jgi:solute carrier family 25 iron transporter 28/37
MQVHGSTYPSITQCARALYRAEGLSTFYVSYPTTLCMTVPFTATQFMAYESLSRVMNPRKEYDPISHCVAGGLAGAFAAGITTPLDAIKTLLQTRGLSDQAEIRNVRGLLNAAAIIRRQYGWSGFFRGLKPRIITTMPSTAICWFVTLFRPCLERTSLLTRCRSSYEMAKAYFKRQRQAATDAYGAKVT